MNNTTFLILFGIVTLINAIIFFFTKRDRKLIQEAKKVIGDDISEASDILDKFYAKLDEFMQGINEISDKSKTEHETSNP